MFVDDEWPGRGLSAFKERLDDDDTAAAGGAGGGGGGGGGGRSVGGNS